MKKYISIILLPALALLYASCSDWNDIEPQNIQKPIENIDEYYQNLRTYKKSDHQICFGWYGGWTGIGASRASRLSSVPDSVDFIGLWGNMWHREKMTPEKAEDLKFVREVKGTQILVTTLLGWTGKELPDIPEENWAKGQEGLIAYAKALAEEIIDLGFDGLDIDYEPTIGGPADVRDCPRGEDMVAFVKELGKYFGPQSGTDRILVIDGQNDLLPAEVGHYFNYAIAQAYGRSSFDRLQSDYSKIKTIFKPEQFIVTENFESYWSTGGVPFSHPKLGSIPSLLGMAYWQPKEGRKGGVGSYHMEYEYSNPETDYKYLRQAIQIMNPAAR